MPNKLLKKRLPAACFAALMSIAAFAQQKAVPAKKVPQPANLGPQLASGKKVYTRYCLSCHQADGGGVQNMNPPLAGTTYISGEKDTIIRIVLKGFDARVEINGQEYGNKMASFSYLKDNEVADVLTYVRNSFGNKAGSVNKQDVGIVRKRLGIKAH